MFVTLHVCALYYTATKAMLDAGINYTEIEQAVVGYVYGKMYSRNCVYSRRPWWDRGVSLYLAYFPPLLQVTPLVVSEPSTS